MSEDARTWAMLVDRGITSRGKFLLVLLSEWADEAGRAEVNVIQLADMAKMDRETVCRAIMKLIDGGLLSRLDDNPIHPDAGFAYSPRSATRPPALDGTGHEMPVVRFNIPAKDERARRVYLEALEGAI